MKKFSTPLIMGLVVMLVLLGFGCGGSGGGSDLLKLLPKHSTLVFYVNVSKLTATKMYDKWMKEAREKKTGEAAEIFGKYDEVTAEIGIDPTKDISAFAISVIGPVGKDPDVAVVANVTYDKGKVLDAIKKANEKHGSTLNELTHNGLTIYSGKAPDGDEFAIAFLNDGTMAMGHLKALKEVVDNFKGTGESVLDSPTLKAHLKHIKGGALMSFVMAVPDEAKKNHNMGMGQADLTKAEALYGHIDHSGSAATGQIALICDNPEGNKTLVDMANGLKGMAGVAGPEAAELVNCLTLTADSDLISLEFDIPDQLIEKLKAKVEEKAKGMGTGMGD